MTKPASLPGEVLAAVKGRGEIPMPFGRRAGSKFRTRNGRKKAQKAQKKRIQVFRHLLSLLRLLRPNAFLPWPNGPSISER
jgi:hypothetical protein